MKTSMFAGAVWLGISAVASAHHSYAEFDMSKRVTLNGTVAKVEWINPHTYVWMYVPKKQGGHDLYAFENGSPAMLRRFGWSKSTLPTGEKVTVLYHPLKDGRPGGSFIRATHADGRVTAGDPYAPGGEKVEEMTRAIPQLKGVIK
jgi:hypothetical protein